MVIAAPQVAEVTEHRLRAMLAERNTVGTADALFGHARALAVKWLGRERSREWLTTLRASKIPNHALHGDLDLDESQCWLCQIERLNLTLVEMRRDAMVELDFLARAVARRRAN